MCSTDGTPAIDSEGATPMAERTPVSVKNLDGYGNPALPWSLPRDLLADNAGSERTFFLGTVGPDGHPHAAGVGAIWFDGDMLIVSGPGTRKSRNMEAHPGCTLSVKLEGMDLILEGDTTRVSDLATLEAAAAIYRGLGWPAQVEGDAFTAPYSAPSAGPPPWNVYRFTITTAFGVAGVEPGGATRWDFDAER
jgi:hypothetical protein